MGEYRKWRVTRATRQGGIGSETRLGRRTRADNNVAVILTHQVSDIKSAAENVTFCQGKVRARFSPALPSASPTSECISAPVFHRFHFILCNLSRDVHANC